MKWSKKIAVGEIMLFTYPNYGTPDGYPDYTQHSGQMVEVIRKLTKTESDSPMYEIKASDGWFGHVNEDELKKVPDQSPVKKMPVKNPLQRALSVWKCECGYEKKLDFKQVSEVGVPFCTCRDNQELELVGIVIDGQQYLKIT